MNQDGVPEGFTRVPGYTRVVSLGVKIRQITGLAGTISVDVDTNKFLDFIEERTGDGRFLDDLTPAHVRWIESIWQEHFA